MKKIDAWLRIHEISYELRRLFNLYPKTLLEILADECLMMSEAIKWMNEESSNTWLEVEAILQEAIRTIPEYYE